MLFKEDKKMLAFANTELGSNYFATWGAARMEDYDMSKIDEFFARVRDNEIESSDFLPMFAACLKAKVVPLVVAAAPKPLPAFVSGENISILTNLNAVLSAIPLRQDASVGHGEVLRALVDKFSYRNVEDLAFSIMTLSAALGTLKGNLGIYDPNVVLTSESGKYNLLNSVKKNKVFLIRDTLLSTLMKYKFNFTFEELNVDMPLTRATWEEVSQGYPWKIGVTHGTQTLTFSFDGSVSGDISKFIDAWNSSLPDDTMEFVHVDDDMMHSARSLLKIYDFNVKDKNWSASRNPLFMMETDVKSIPRDMFEAVDRFVGLVAAKMSAMPYADHFNERFTSYVIAVTRMDVKLFPPEKFFETVDVILMTMASKKTMNAQDHFKKFMSNVVISQIHKATIEGRAERLKYRNVGFREVLTKVMMDPLYPFAPNAVSTVRKFKDIVSKNFDLYKMETDVYGCARMHFVDALTRGFADAPNNWVAGRRNFFDIKVQFCNNNMGHLVTSRDFYSIGPDVGKGKGVIDDIDGVCKMSITENYPVGDRNVPVVFKGDCMSHKLRIVYSANYSAGVLKMFVEKLKDVDLLNPAIGGGWLIPLSFYKKVSFDSPGKMQSGEFFIYFSERQPTTSLEYITLLSSKWATFIRKKCSVMYLANAYMDAGTMTNPVLKRKQFFNKALIKGVIPPAIFKTDWIVNMRNSLLLQLCRAPVNCFIGYIPVGKYHDHVVGADKDAAVMEVEDIGGSNEFIQYEDDDASEEEEGPIGFGPDLSG
jgi:hypothetical protein